MIASEQKLQHGKVLALCGGIGGVKLALGLSKIITDEQLVISVNTGDDFDHLGLHISPDVDTVTYTLAGIANRKTGWGRADETWNFMKSLETLGGETWFRLGDQDLATHVERTRRLRGGERLSTITEGFCKRLGIAARILPMSEDPVRTCVDTNCGPMPFQNYFVERRCEPEIKSIRFEGAESASLQSDIAMALKHPDLRCVIICPSNPYLSIDPMLAVSGMRQLLQDTHAPVVAVSPLVGGTAVKGPMAKVMGELDCELSHATISHHYEGFIDGLMIDSADSGIPDGVAVAVEDTMMHSLEDKMNLARTVLAFADDIAAGRSMQHERLA